MATEIEYLVQNDTKPSLTFTVEDDAGDPVDISTSTVTFHFANSDTLAVVNTGHQGCTITDGPNGVCRYDWDASDLVNEGSFVGELQVVFADSSIQTVYTIINFFVRPELD